MKKVIMCLFLLLSNLFYSQEHKSLKEFMQDFYKKNIPLILKDNEKWHFNSYFKNDELYIICENDSDVSYTDSDQIKELYQNRSKDFIYSYLAPIFTANNGEVLTNYENEMNSKYINFSFIIKSNDFKEWINSYFVAVADLYKISPYYNREDFYLILKRK